MPADPPVSVHDTDDTAVVPPVGPGRKEADEHPADWYRRPAVQALGAFLLYLAAALLLWGLPIGFDLASRHVGMGGNDTRLYMWAFEWTPHAITHGLDPFHTDLVYAPGGADLRWVTTMPGPALALWPVTAWFGSLASVNVAMLLGPALAAWAGYLVCRRVTRSFLPSLAGGWLVGFSSYMAGQMYGHANLVLIFPAILAVYLAVRRAEGSIGGGTYVGFLALCVVGLFSISTELVATASLFGAIALLGAWAFGGEARGRVLRTGLESITAYLAAAVVLSPILLPALDEAPADPVRLATTASVDLLSFVVPRRSILLGGDRYLPTTEAFTSNTSEDGAYLGIVVLAMLVAFAVSRWRRPQTWLLLAFIAVVALLSLGPVLHVRGIERFGLPGAVLRNAPIIEHATPQRFSAYLWLPVGVIAATWLATARAGWAWTRWTVVGLAAITLLPLVESPPRGREVPIPRFFTDGSFAGHLEPGEIVFAVPTVKGDEMVWLAAADFRFRLAQGYIGPIPPAYLGQGLSKGLALHHPSPFMPPAKVLQRYAQLHRVSTFVSSQEATPMFEELLREAGWRPQPVEDVVVWRLADPAGSPG
ncbi:MAG TPA: hypothetical protein VFQ40_08150 [Actinomycetota bacterium]|nr:hypothetical protein [Actinomycetota bacterium]